MANMRMLSNRAFGLMFTVVFTIITCVGWLIFDRISSWPLGISVTFLAVSLVLPAALLPLNRLWGFIAGGVSRFNNVVVLGLFYYLIMMPIGMIMRVFGWDPMNKANDHTANTYWQPVERKISPETFSDMF